MLKKEAAELIPQYFNLSYAPMPNDRTHNLRVSGVATLPLGKKQTLFNRGLPAILAGGFHLNAIVSFYSGAPFSVSADGASLNAPRSSQRADQVKGTGSILLGVGLTSVFIRIGLRTGVGGPLWYGELGLSTRSGVHER